MTRGMFRTLICCVCVILSETALAQEERLLVSDSTQGLFFLDGLTGVVSALPPNAISDPIAAAMILNDRAIVLTGGGSALRINLSSGLSGPAVDPQAFRNPVAVATRAAGTVVPESDAAFIVNPAYRVQTGGEIQLVPSTIISVSPQTDVERFYPPPDQQNSNLPIITAIALDYQERVVVATGAITTIEGSTLVVTPSKLHRFEASSAITTLRTFPNDGAECILPAPGGIVDVVAGIVPHWSGHVFVLIIEVNCYISGGAQVRQIVDARVERIVPGVQCLQPQDCIVWDGDGVAGSELPNYPVSLNMDRNGHLILADSGPPNAGSAMDGNIYRLNVKTGDMTRISNNGLFQEPLHVVRTPEPTTTLGLVVGAMLLSGLARRRRFN